MLFFLVSRLTLAKKKQYYLEVIHIHMENSSTHLITSLKQT